ncbi:hypothetical protein CR513_34033, partial [Mucuna pruriens]
MKKDDDNSEINVVKTIEDDDMFLAITEKLENGEKVKVEGVGNVRTKLYNSVIQTLHNVRFSGDNWKNICYFEEKAMR